MLAGFKSDNAIRTLRRCGMIYFRAKYYKSPASSDTQFLQHVVASGSMCYVHRTSRCQIHMLHCCMFLLCLVVFAAHYV